MTNADRKLVNKAIQDHGDDWWNDDNDENGEGSNPNRDWVVDELLEILAKNKLDLKVVRKKK